MRWRCVGVLDFREFHDRICWILRSRIGLFEYPLDRIDWWREEEHARFLRFTRWRVYPRMRAVSKCVDCWILRWFRWEFVHLRGGDRILELDLLLEIAAGGIIGFISALILIMVVAMSIGGVLCIFRWSRVEVLPEALLLFLQEVRVHFSRKWAERKSKVIEVGFADKLVVELRSEAIGVWVNKRGVMY